MGNREESGWSGGVEGEERTIPGACQTHTRLCYIHNLCEGQSGTESEVRELE